MTESNAEITSKLAADELGRLKGLWNGVELPRTTTPSQGTLFLGAGVNFRLNLGRAFVAAWETSKAAVKGIAAAHAPFAIWAWLEAGAEAAGAIHAIFVSLVDRMQPIDYVTAVILANQPFGLTDDELKSKVETYLANPDETKFAWYLAMSGEKIDEAKESAEAPNWFELTKKELTEKSQMMVVDAITGRLTFQEVNFEIEWKREK
jgi:hypothetical protein